MQPSQSLLVLHAAFTEPSNLARLTWPTPPIKVAAVFVLDEQALVPRLSEHLVVVVVLEVGVHNGHHLATFRRDVAQHFHRVGELGAVPGEVPIPHSNHND